MFSQYPHAGFSSSFWNHWRARMQDLLCLKFQAFQKPTLLERSP
jgi:hypothetical protein